MDADQVVANVFTAVEVDDFPFGRHRVVERRAILGDVERLDAEDLTCKSDAPVEDLGSDAEPGQVAVRELLRERQEFRSSIRPGPDEIPRVKVEAEEVGRLGDDVEVAALDARRVRRFEQGVGIDPSKDRPHELAVGPLVLDFRGGDIERRLRHRDRRGRQMIVNQPNLRTRPAVCPDDPYPMPMSQDRMMIRLVEHLGRLATPRREIATPIAVADEARDLVHREPAVNPVAQPLHDHLGIAGIGRHRLARRPPPLVLERLGQIPVEQGHPGLDPSREQGVDQSIIEVEPETIHRPVAIRNDPRPGDREPVMPEAEVPDQVGVLFITMVVVASDGGTRPLLDLAGQGRESVPDRFPFAVLGRPPFDLARRGRHAPGKVVGESIRQGGQGLRHGPGTI